MPNEPLPNEDVNLEAPEDDRQFPSMLMPGRVLEGMMLMANVGDRGEGGRRFRCSAAVGLDVFAGVALRPTMCI